MTAAREQKSPLTRLSYAFATWFGLGFSKIAPGTAGSIGTVPLYLLLREQPAVVYWVVTATISVLGCFAAHRVAEVEENDDPSLVVIDEVAGTLIALGLGGSSPSWLLLVSFGLFRLLDITKPWPIHRLEHVPPTGLGVMLDDLFAGLAAGILTAGVGMWIN
jgi:phosphatidylglycerophosphatase A